MFRPPFAMPTLQEFLVWHSRNDADPGHTSFRELTFGVGPHLLAAEALPPDRSHRAATSFMTRAKGDIRD